MDFKILGNKFFYLIYGLIVILVSVYYINKSFHEKNAFKNTHFVLGFLSKINIGDAKNGQSGIIEYEIDSIKYELRVKHNFLKSDFGYPFCVEVSLADPNVAKLVSTEKCR